jgi:hypothetical protein
MCLCSKRIIGEEDDGRWSMAVGRFIILLLKLLTAICQRTTATVLTTAN